MLNRRSFLSRVSRMLGGSALISTKALRQASVGSAVASSVGASLLVAQSSPAPWEQGEDWTKDTRYGLEYWKVTRQKIEWPNKARIAFMCSVPFESVDVGDPMRGGGNPSSASVSYNLYGGKVGIWRILDILDRHNIKGNFVTHGFCAYQFPETVRAIVDRGHEIIARPWGGHREMSLAEERAYIHKSVTALQEASGGKRPVCWVAPGWNLSVNTNAILVEEGFTCTANSPSSDDIPYTVMIGGKKLVVVVQETVLNDNGFFKNFNSPSTYVDYLKRDFDRKYADAATKGGMIFNFVIHSHQSGRPFFADALDEIIAYTKTFPDVWYTTRQPIVEWWLQKNYS